MGAAELCPELGEYVRAELARLSIVAHPCADAPDSMDRLRAETWRDDAGRLHVPVWNGASERTIWADVAGNVAFRAWHDSTHLATGLGFDPAAELELARRTVADARARGLSAHACAVLWAETAGQIEHYLAHGETFPDDQRAFVDAHARGAWNGERF